jgi:predicted ATP-dependent endonuclease of OLD family
LVFQVESEEAHREAILLLDEPGLHLHPTLQQRLVRLFERISKKNQLLYSTHLPFLVDGDHLDRVRTVYLNAETSRTVVSPDVRAGADYETLFPLQAALGYSIAQTLFMGKKCVIVEGITDYWILKALDATLADGGAAVTLDPEIVLIPAGGTSRLMPLASLMFGAAGVHGANMLVLLDTDKAGAQAKTRLDTELFSTGSRVVTVGWVLGRTDKTTIEDFVERPTYIAALNAVGYAVSLAAAEQSNSSMVDACESAFRRLGLGDFDQTPKAKAALWLVDQWAKDRAAVEQATLQRASALFEMINKRFL